MMWRSWNKAMPPDDPKLEAGQLSLSTPVMVILGSLGCSTITTASMLGMVIQVSSPKHLEIKGIRVRSGWQTETPNTS